jgi:hypothetical protein
MPSPPRRRFLAVLTFVMSAAMGCATSHDEALSPDELLAPYTPEAAVLFDDVIAPPVFGFDPEGRDPSRDPKLRERTRQADFVVPARVETVSRVGGLEHKGAYEITLAATGPAFAGDPAGTPLVLQVPSTNPSYAWVDGAGAAWVGSHVLLFARHYREGRGTALHFRCESDTPELRKAVERDAGLRLLR